jgi:hypothetical protein
LVVAVAVLVVAVLYDSDPASAAGPGETWANTVEQGCSEVLDLPASFFGSTTGGGIAVLGFEQSQRFVFTSTAGAATGGAAASSTVTAGGLLAAAPTAGLLLGVGVGGFCAAFNGLNWLAGNPVYEVPEYNGPALQTWAGPCEDLAGYTPVGQGSPQCVTVGVPATHNWGRLGVFRAYLDGVGGVHPVCETVRLTTNLGQTGVLSNPACTTSSYSVPLSPAVTLEFDCRTRLMCVIDPVGAKRQRTNDPVETAPWVDVWMSGVGSVSFPLDFPWLETGGWWRYHRRGQAPGGGVGDGVCVSLGCCST